MQGNLEMDSDSPSFSDYCRNPAVGLLRSEIPPLNLRVAESHLTSQFVNPPSKNLYEHTMGLLGEVFLLPLT
jgi:hypothetical protein